MATGPLGRSSGMGAVWGRCGGCVGAVWGRCGGKGPLGLFSLTPFLLLPT